MSLLWDRDRKYTAFKFRIYTNSTVKDKLCFHWYPCPGFIGHMVSKRKRHILFEHYNQRPQKSWLVYWRSHPFEYKKILNEVTK